MWSLRYISIKAVFTMSQNIYLKLIDALKMTHDYPKCPFSMKPVVYVEFPTIAGSAGAGLLTAELGCIPVGLSLARFKSTCF